MKITVFTSNQPRHLAYLEKLSGIAERVTAVVECTTVAPGQVADFYSQSGVMGAYFSSVMKAERKIFGRSRFLPKNVQMLPIRMGDLNLVSRESLTEVLDSDVYLVFGASYIKGWLIEELVTNRAINIHMGLSPYYRGAACNFWAMYDRRPAFVGATVHLLSPGLDSGQMLFHVRPEFNGQNTFDFTMEAVEKVQSRIVEKIAAGTIFENAPVQQDMSKQLRYSRNADFTDEIASTFLSQQMDPAEIQDLLQGGVSPEILHG